LLCGLLESTGIAGRPESYFRREDRGVYAERWGVPRSAHGGVDVGAFVRAADAAGSTPNGVYGARVMWGTMTQLTDALASVNGHDGATALELLTNAFGSLRFLHLRRVDTVAQAVSWARAEQTNFWHPADHLAAGGDKPSFDRALIAELISTIDAHEAAWHTWFDDQRVTPCEVTYEDLAADPVGVTLAVLGFLGFVLPAEQTIMVRDRRQADELNAAWIDRFKKYDGAATWRRRAAERGVSFRN
jgi:LPS sulfotransferase NodH